jgi:hypothetical protein
MTAGAGSDIRNDFARGNILDLEQRKQLGSNVIQNRKNIFA